MKNYALDSNLFCFFKLTSEWDKELKLKKGTKKEPSFLAAIYRAFGFWYLMAGSLSILSVSWLLFSGFLFAFCFNFFVSLYLFLCRKPSSVLPNQSSWA